MLYRFLFPVRPEGAKTSLLLLAARVIFRRIADVARVAEVGRIRADGRCLSRSVGRRQPFLADAGHIRRAGLFVRFLIGFLYRLAMIPMIFTMAMAFFVIHSQDAFAVRELALVYLVVFVLMYIAGPGKFAVDRYFAVKERGR